CLDQQWLRALHLCFHPDRRRPGRNRRQEADDALPDRMIPDARASLFALVLAVLSVAATSARGEDIGPFYQAYAIVTGTDVRQRPWGMAQCLREVFVKVSGDPRLKEDPRVLELATHADRFVASFDYVDLMAGIPKKDDQGSYDRPHKLTVRFDPA